MAMPAPPGRSRLSRRLLLAAAGGAWLARPAFAAAPAGADALTPAEALHKLMDGNARYVAGMPIRPNLDEARRRTVAGGQHPFASIVACADSRVGPELIFDQGLGDLFVVRVAGNVVDDVVLASVEYSVIHLGSPLVMVLGHERCGAVAATIDALAGKMDEEDKDTKIAALATLIGPAVRAVPAAAPDKLEAAVLLNAEGEARRILAGSRPLSERARAGRLQVVSARYDLDGGAVTHVAPVTV